MRAKRATSGSTIAGGLVVLAMRRCYANPPTVRRRAWHWTATSVVIATNVAPCSVSVRSWPAARNRRSGGSSRGEPSATLGGHARNGLRSQGFIQAISLPSCWPNLIRWSRRRHGCPPRGVSTFRAEATTDSGALEQARSGLMGASRNDRAEPDMCQERQEQIASGKRGR
jgi:hypothetical protein